MTHKIPKESIKRLQDMNGPIPDGCVETVEALLEHADVLWEVFIAVLVRMKKKDKRLLKDAIKKMMEGFPDDLTDWDEIDAQFNKYFDDMDNRIAGISRDIDEYDE